MANTDTSTVAAGEDPARLAIAHLTAVRDMTIGLQWRAKAVDGDYVPIGSYPATTPAWVQVTEDIGAEVQRRLDTLLGRSR
jgi:hypothetical protein